MADDRSTLGDGAHKLAEPARPACSSKRLAKWELPPIGPERQAVADALTERSPREAAIMGHALVEATLDELVRASCVAKPDSRIFGAGGLLGSYYALFTVSHAFGLIPSELRNELEIIGTIRNAFGHSFNDIDFDSPFMDIGKNCRLLKRPKIYEEVNKSIGLHSGEVYGQSGILLVDGNDNIGAQVIL
jgi:hypothetical protein